MYSLNRTGSSRATNIWPAFVDGLATLILVFIFVLLFFLFTQFFLALALSDKSREVTSLDRRLAELTELLSLEQKTGEELRTANVSLTERLQATLTERDALTERTTFLLGENERLENTLAEAAVGGAELSRDLGTARVRLEEVEVQQRLLESLRERLVTELASSATALARERALVSEQSRENAILAEEAALLNRNLEELRLQLAALAEALDASEASNKEQEVEIINLGNRLNSALAGKVQELSRYRSEFFGRLSEALGDNPNVRVVGDRFVLPTSVLFESSSAELGDEGQARLRQLSDVLRQIAATIPPDIDWILRVDGHTDDRPIATSRFPSNWELSAARAISVVRALSEGGIPPERLVAAGFGEFQPITPGRDPVSLARNRRIEFKLTER